MISYPCDYPDCNRKTIPGGDDCRFCHRHLCGQHYTEKIHNCGKKDYDPVQNLIDTDKMWARLQKVVEHLDIFGTAESLRPGRKVTRVDLDVQKLPGGNRNVHVPIVFDDGVGWIARIRHIGIGIMPRLIERKVLQTEMDTMKWLKRLGVPVAKVRSEIFSHGDTDFFFMEMLSGKACQCPVQEGDLDDSTLSQIIEDFAKLNIHLSHHPLRQVGSIHHNKQQNTFTVGPLISPISAEDAEPHFPGPCRTSGDKWRYHIDGILRSVEAGEIYVSQAEEAALVFRWIREVVDGYPPFNVEDHETFVINEDANGGHIMVDEAGYITGLIDWEWATVGAKCEAFASPMGFVDNATYYKGSNELSSTEVKLIEAYKRLGRPDLADCVTAGKPYQWLTGTVACGEWMEHKYLRALAESVGLEIESTREEFLAAQRAKQGIPAKETETKAE